MMIQQVVSVVDAAVGAFGRPIYVAALGVAIRIFQDEINRVTGHQEEPNMLNKHPEDHTLYHLGEFDDVTGQHRLLPAPVALVKGSDVVKG